MYYKMSNIFLYCPASGFAADFGQKLILAAALATRLFEGGKM
jgi:hypothetical protein